MIRIVIYDDNRQRRDSLEALVQLTENMECTGSFPDCSNVLEDISLCLPDVVLMDIEMPNGDGITGVKKIKQHFPEVRIVMQTVFEDEERIFASLKAGAEGYILKNASAERITQSIEEVYMGGAYMTPSVAFRVTNFFSQAGKNPASENYKLTLKETEVLKLLADGKSYKMVADALGISYFTVNSHVKKIYEKLHVHSLAEAVSLAYKNNIV
jgi:DNA-binding NarL/FixJ family response regulator